MIFYHALSEAILYHGKPLDFSNTLVNSQYLEKLVLPDFGVTEYTLDVFHCRWICMMTTQHLLARTVVSGFHGLCSLSITDSL